MKELLCLLIILTMPWTVSAASEAAGAPVEDAASEETGDDEQEEETEELPEVDVGSLRNRELGDAFENFQPSEEISVDNAVTYPVDI